MNAAPASVGFSLARGGLFYSILQRLGLWRNDAHDVRRQSFALAVVSWVPLAIIAGLEELLHGRPPQLISEISVHVRLLVALPLFVAAEHMVNERCGRAIDLFVGGRFAADAGAVDLIVKRACDLRDSWWPELILLSLVVTISQFSLWSGTGSGLFVTEELMPAREMSLTHLYYSFVGMPLFQFLLGRTIWRWFIWSRILWHFSRLRLRLVPTHPDLAGGIADLSRPSEALSIAFLGVSAVLAGAWGEQILVGQTSLTALAAPFAILVVLGEIVAVGPLLFFALHLMRGRYVGLNQYSLFALRYTRDFHIRWIAPRDEPAEQEQLLGTADIQSLADLSNSFKIVEDMRFVPFGPRALVVVFLATAFPMLPLLLTTMSLWEIFARIGKGLMGGFPR